MEESQVPYGKKVQVMTSRYSFIDISILLSEKQTDQKLIFQTYHSLMRKWLPFFCPVKRVVECWLASLYLGLP